MSGKKRTRPPQRGAAPKPAPSSALVLREPRAGDGAGEPQITVTAEGLALIERLSANGGSRNIVAAGLGVGRATFHRLLDRDENVKMAYEAGRARDEQFHVSVLRKAASKGVVIASIFALKAKHGWTEQQQPTTQNNIQIVSLPAPMTPEQYAVHLAQRDAAASLPAPTDAQVIDVESTIVKETTNAE